MRGRKPLIDLKALEIGERLELTNKAALYPHQFVRSFNGQARYAGSRFEVVRESDRVFVTRTA